MEYQDLEQLVSQGLSLRQIAARSGRSQGSVRHWLKKYGLRTRRGPWGKSPKDFKEHRRCACGETRPEKFYGHKISVCGTCHNRYTTQRGREKRERAVRHLGGKCSNPECGFDRYLSALHSHHMNPEEKDLDFASYRGWSWARLERELAKCILLCACCHAAVHADELEVTWV